MNGDEHRHRDQQEPKSRFDNLLVTDEPGVLGDYDNEQVRHQQQEPDQKRWVFFDERRTVLDVRVALAWRGLSISDGSS